MEVFDYIKKRQTRMEADRQTWEDHWQQILDYVMPRKADITFTRSQGESRTDILFDSTAITANNLLAASLQGTLTSPSLAWFHLKLRNEELNNQREVQLWLEDTARRMYDMFNESNFNTEVHEMYLDLTSIGTGAMLVEDGDVGLPDEVVHFRTLHIAEYYIQENINGQVDTLYRKYSMTARQAVQEFGEENLGEKVLKAAKEKPDKSFVFIHAVEPTADYERALGKAKTKLPFHSCHVCEEDKMVVRTSGYQEFPYLVPRWAKATGEIFGRSPSYNALPDIKTLNKAVEIGLKAWAKAIDPPLLVTDDGVIGRVRMTPAGITVVRSDGAVKPLQIASNWQVTDMKENQLRTAIRQAYYSDQLQLQEGPQMTATEVQVRYELMQRLLGPTLGRFQTEFLNPLIERVFGLMFRKGQFMTPPDNISEANMDIEYVGPLARSQRMEEAVAVERLYQLAMTIGQANPDIMDLIDHDKAVRLRAKLLGVPKNILRGEAEVNQIRQQRIQQQQMAMQQQQALEQAKTANATAHAAQKASTPQVQEMLNQVAGLE